MKKIFGALAMAVVMVSSCKKVKDLADISVNIPYTQHVSVPPVDGYDFGVPLPNGGLNIGLPAVSAPTNSKSYLEQYHTNADKVRKVALNSLSLELTGPPTQNFDFVDTVRLYISAPDHSEMLVAYKYGTSTGTRTLTLTTNTDVNLKDYFLEDTMTFRATMHINAVPAPGAEMDIKSVFNLVANPLY